MTGHEPSAVGVHERAPRLAPALWHLPARDLAAVPSHRLLQDQTDGG